MYRQDQQPWPGGLPNLRMNGVIRASGGHYDNVQVDGVGRISGDLRAATAIRVNGVLNVDGSIDSPDLKADGKLSMNGALRANTIRVEGIVKVGKEVAAESIRLNGILKAQGNIEAEKLQMNGVLTVEGLLNAGQVELGLSHMESKAQEIGGETILVRRIRGNGWKWLWKWAIPGSETRLTADIIEGDDVKLEYTHADIVRGHRVTIGKGCKIGRVEYRDELIRRPGSEIAKEERTHG